jgi:DNA-binding NarL/FixJ family response regulator
VASEESIKTARQLFHWQRFQNLSMFVTQILVVDDFLPWQWLVSKMFESEPNLKIISFASEGFEAVQKAKELQPDVILMDVSPPKLNGIEAARQIRKVAPNSKILFVSTYTSSEIAEGALDTGASGYVVKLSNGTELFRLADHTSKWP